MPKLQEDEEDAELDGKPLTPEQIRADQSKWEIDDFNNGKSASTLLSHTSARDILHKYLNLISKHNGKKWDDSKKLAKRYLDEINQGHYIMAIDIEFHDEPFKKQVCLVNRNDVIDALNDLKFAIIKKRLANRKIRQWKQSLVKLSDNFGFVKKEIISLVKDNKSKLRQELATNIDCINIDIKEFHTGEDEESVKGYHNNSELIELLNDLQDQEEY